MDRRLLAVFTTVFLDMTGMSLILPVLPNLLREVTHQNDLGWRFGAFLGVYGLMQFLSTPLLGALSDRIGRRPVIMLALAGAAVDYLFMAFAPTLPLLFIGRAIAGVTAANMAVATAYVTHITPEDQRARRFGQFSAVIGLGFIAGPALGGLLGVHWVRLPFMAAAILNAANLAFVATSLRESRADRNAADTLILNPFGPLRWALSLPMLAPLIGAYIIMALVGQIGGTVWVVYGEDRFGWTPLTVGISLAGFGLFHALTQAFVAGWASERWGERKTILLGMASDFIGNIIIAVISHGWIAFLLLPVFCLGGIGIPSLQALLSRGVDPAHQGRLQGMLASLNSLAGIGAPLLISFLYFATRATFPGFIWLIGAALYLPCLPLVFIPGRAAEDRV